MTSSPEPRLVAFGDVLLGARLRHATGDELYRARLIVITSLLVAGCGSIFVVLILALGWRADIAPLVASASVILAVSVWRLRRTGQLAPAALTFCVTILALMFVISWRVGGIAHPALDWTLLVVMIAPMVIRPTLVLGCVLLIVVNVTVMYAASRAGHYFPPVTSPLGLGTWSQVLLTVLVGWLAWAYDRARRDALAERDAAFASLEESRAARLALVENVQAVVYSIDRDLHLIAGNSSFDRVSHAEGEPPIAPGQSILDGLAATQHADMRALYARAFAGEHFAVERTLELPAASFECEILFNPIRSKSGKIRSITVLGRDIGDRNRAAAELQRLNHRLAAMSHLAGKAEVATDVLHNVGTVLTSLNSNANLILEQLLASKVSLVGKTFALLPDSQTELAQFLATDERGRQVRQYLPMLADHLEHEHADMIAAMTALHEQLDRLKAVVARQQSNARVDNLIEIVPIGEVITDALQLNAVLLDKSRITVATEIAALPPVGCDRHKVVEIVTNLLANSREALEVPAAVDKRITVRAFRNQQGRLQIDIVDNGVGFAPDQLDHLFRYGYTTKPHGHGFGLAGSLLAARSMGGTMRACSDGAGKGATFTIELPFESTAANPMQERAA